MRAFSMAIVPSAMPRHYHEAMEVLVIRHAKAEDRDAEAWPDDSLRPLTRDGAREFERVASRLRDWRPSVDMVLSSGFVRAWDTARILRAKARWPKPVRTKMLEDSGAGAAPAMAAFLAEQPEDARIALVGHEPMLGELVAALAGEPGGIRLDFRKGAVAWLRGDPGAMRLAGLLAPAMLRSR
jgi:phosphohistidine phosphatase